MLSIFTASWRISLTALGIQAFGIGGFLLTMGHGSISHNIVVLIELFVLKGALIPAFIYRRFGKTNVPRYIDLIPANLLHWGIAVLFVWLACSAAYLIVPTDKQQMILLSASLSAVALGMMALSNQHNIPGQIISVLTIENGISLFAIGNLQDMPIILEIFLLFDFTLFVLLSINFLRHIGSDSIDSKLPETDHTLDFGDIL